jgi:mono/diheme cytochrome c family protein/plastocyanin
MNTAKQVNVMVGLLMVFAFATLLYFLWDDDRASEATDRQLFTNAERGGALYSVNCRACHGLNGKGPLESSILPGAPLNAEDPYRLQDATVASRQQRYRDTIRCGRIGTVMPSWHQDYGGPLNDFQIQQLVTLITGVAWGETSGSTLASEEGWAHAVEQANHSDAFAPAKHLVEAVSPEDVTFVLNNARGLRPGGLLRIDDEPTDEVYEVVTIVDAPAGSVLAEKVNKDATELTVQEAAVFHPGDIIVVGGETMQVVAAPASTALVTDISPSATTITVVDTQSLAPRDIIKIDGEKMTVQFISGDTVRVERGAEDTEVTEHLPGAPVTEQGKIIEVKRAQEGTAAAGHNVTTSVFEVGDSIEVERAAHGTRAAEHAAETEVFNGPILPGNSVTGDPNSQGFPPCGQRPAAATPGTVETVELGGSADVSMGDNFFEIDGKRNPTFQIAAGSAVTISLTNGGTAIHNLRTTGDDGEFDTDDDHVSVPLAVNGGGGTGTIEGTFAVAGTYQYRCDFHTADMKGEITVQ